MKDEEDVNNLVVSLDGSKLELRDTPNPLPSVLCFRVMVDFSTTGDSESGVVGKEVPREVAVGL